MPGEATEEFKHRVKKKRFTFTVITLTLQIKYSVGLEVGEEGSTSEATAEEAGKR